MSKITTQQANERLKKYNFEIVGEYVGRNNLKQKVRCLVCGTEKEAQFVNLALGKCKCKGCLDKPIIEKRKKIILDYLQRTTLTLDESCVDFMDRQCLVTLRCSDCGEMTERKLETLLYAPRPCPYCKLSSKKRTLSRLIEACGDRNLGVLSDKYEDPVNVYCLSCGTKRTISVSMLLDTENKQYCKVCNYEEWLHIKYCELWDNGYELLDFDYRERGLNCSVDSNMKCKNCESTFLGNIYSYTDANRRMKGYCPCCFDGSFGFNDEMEGYFYYLRVNTSHGKLYKIGITNRSIEERYPYKVDRDNITTLRVLKFEKGSDARQLERYYLNLFKDFKYTGEPILKSGGNTEVMTKDILCLDK